MTALPKSSLPIFDIPVAGILPSPSNPRKTFKAIDELAENIKANGIKVPLRVRPISATDNASGHYELVFGERRWRAAKKAGLEVVPAIVEELSDAEALQLMLVELAQTSDVHPVEEAEAYLELHQRHGLSVEEIAAKVGKSKRTVYERMQLCALATPVKEASLKGDLSPSHALLIARVPAALQEEALHKILEGEYGDGVMNYQEARDFVQGTYMLSLGDAPWSLKDEQLVPEAGSCAKCPKRTGNQPELFHDVKARDTCTDPACFKSKKQAYVKLTLAKAQEEGKTVLGVTEAKKAVGAGELVELDKFDYRLGKSVAEALGKKKDKIDVVLAPSSNGEVKELARAEDVEKLLPKEKPEQDDKWKKQQEKNDAERARRDRLAQALLDELKKKIEAKGFAGKGNWFILAEMQLKHWNEGEDEEPVRRWLEHEPEKESIKDFEELKAKLPKMKQEQLQAFVVETVLDEAMLSFRQKQPNALSELAASLGIDEKKVAERVKEEMAAEKKAKEKALQEGIVDKETGEIAQTLPAPKKKQKKGKK